jgi:outer membrane receptor for ferrienterochelin and colicins
MRDHSRLFWPVAVLAVVLAQPAAAQEPAARCAPAAVTPADLASMDLESLMNIKVVTASKASEHLAEAPGVISVVTRDELMRFGGTTLRDVLERVPGLESSTAYFTDRSLLAARGDQTKINGGHVLFLINGRPTREVLEGGVVSDLLESFPADALERIEVIKGPGSVLYGSNAFSAVVNLIPIKAEKSGLSVSGSPGAWGARRTSAHGAFVCGDLSIVATGQFTRKPDWSTTYRFSDPIPGDELAVPVPAVQDISIGDRGRGGFVGLTFKNLNVMTAFTEWRTAAFIRGTVGENRWRRGFADVGYRLEGNGAWSSTVNLTYTRNLFAIEQFPFIQRDSDETVAEWTSVMKHDRDQLTVGALYNHVRGHETYYGLGFPLPISNGRRSGGAAYAQLDHRLSSTVTLIGGLQANKISVLELDVVPRGGVIWNPRPRLNVKALYGQAYRAPSINETTLDHPGLTGMPDLRPERVATFDAALAYYGDVIQSSVGYFHSHHTDSITIDSRPQRWRYVNLGEATFQGIEFDGKVYLSKQLYALGSFLYQVNEDGNGVANITPVPNTGAKIGVSYTNRGITASMFDVYQGSIDGYTSLLNPAPRSHHLLSGHLRVELAKLLHAPRDTGLAFVVDADNLANNQIWLPDWGGNTGDTIPARRGRTVFFGAEVSLGERAASTR